MFLLQSLTCHEKRVIKIIETKNVTQGKLASTRIFVIDIQIVVKTTDCFNLQSLPCLLVRRRKGQDASGQ